jgi:hypothetical protein
MQALTLPWRGQADGKLLERVLECERAMQERAKEDLEVSMQKMDVFLNDNASAAAVEKGIGVLSTPASTVVSRY